MSSRPTARSSRPRAGPPRAPRSRDTEDAIAAVVEELAAGHDGELVGVGVGAAGWFDRTGDTVLFSPHLAWRNSTLRKDLAGAAAATAVGGQRRRRRGLGRVPLRRGPRRRPRADDHAGHRHRRRHRAGRPAAARLARRRGGVGAHARSCPTAGCAPAATAAAGSSTPAAPRSARPRARSPARRRRRPPGCWSGWTATPTGSPARTSPAPPPTATRWRWNWSPRSACWLGQGIADLAAVLDPEVVVIGGGVSKLGEMVLAPGARAAGAGAARPGVPARARGSSSPSSARRPASSAPPTW